MSRALKGIRPETMVYLAPEHTFTYYAAMGMAERYGVPANDRHFIGMKSNLGVIRAVANEEVKSGMVPLQNIAGGRPLDVVDGLWRYGHSDGIIIVDTGILPISMCIGGKCELSEVKKVVSKDVAILQCNKYTEETLSDFEEVNAGSTAEGIRRVAENTGGQYEYAAALGPREAFEHFGVRIYAEDIGNVKSDKNQTRFGLIMKRKTGIREEGKTLTLGRPKGGTECVTTVAVKPKRAYGGLLSDLLRLALDCDVEVRDTYGTPTGSDTNIVLLDMNGYRSDGNVRGFLDRLSDSGGKIGNKTESVELGSYPYSNFFPPKVKTIGVVGGDGTFYREHGFNTIVSDGENIEKVAQRSDAIVITGADNEGVGNILEEIREESKGKLVVVNSPDIDNIMGSASVFGSAKEMLYIDTPFMEGVPMEGENAIVIGDDTFDPASMASEFVGAYDDSGAKVTFTDAKTYGTYRGFARYGSRLSALFYLGLAGELGIDFSKLYNFTSAGETIFTNAVQGLLAADESAGLHTYLQRRGEMVREVALDMCNTPKLSVDGLADLSKKALKSSSDVDRAIKITTGLYPYLFGKETLTKVQENQTGITIGVIGGKRGVNEVLGKFYTEHGYRTILADKTDNKTLAQDSNIVVINRAGRGGAMDILEEIAGELEEKLVVINSSRPAHIMKGISGLDDALDILYMDVPVVKSVPIAGQNVIFIGGEYDFEFERGSMQLKFTDTYEKSGANVTFTDFEKHGKYRGFAMHGSILSSLFYLGMAGELGIDFRRLTDFTSAGEALFDFAAQKILTLDRNVYAKSLFRYLEKHGGVVKKIALGISNTPDLSVEGLAELSKNALKSSNDIGGAAERATELCKQMLKNQTA